MDDENLPDMNWSSPPEATDVLAMPINAEQCIAIPHPTSNRKLPEVRIFKLKMTYFNFSKMLQMFFTKNLNFPISSRIFISDLTWRLEKY